MKKLFYTLLIVSQIGLIWQKFWAYDSIHWAAVFVPVYVLAIITFIYALKQMKNESE